MSNTGVVDQAMQAASAFAHGFNGCVDLFLDRDIQANGLDIIQRIQRVHVFLLARAGVNEISL